MTKKSLVIWTLITSIAGCFGYAIVQHNTASAQLSETFGGNIVLARPTDRSITVNVIGYLQSLPWSKEDGCRAA